MNKPQPSNVVVKSNKLIEASYKLSVQEKRLIYLLITQINIADEEFKEYSFSVNQIKEFLGIKGERYYSDIQNIARDLMTKVLTIKEENSVLLVHWVSSARYLNNEGRLILRFAPEMKPYLLQLKKGFTKILVKNVINLTSIYSVRIYELLKQFEGIGSRQIKLDELKKMLQAQKSYDIYNNFKRKVLEMAQREINEKTDISFEYREIKDARKVVAINFIITTKPEPLEQLQLPEPSTISDIEPIHQASSEAPVLTELKIYLTEKKANWCFEKYGADYCAKKISLAKYTDSQGKIRTTFAAYLIDAIEKDYKDPRESAKIAKELRTKKSAEMKKQIFEQDAAKMEQQVASNIDLSQFPNLAVKLGVKA